MRVQELMPDILLWLGVKQIDQFVSMSDMKFNALARSGIEVKKRVTIPKELIPEDAQVEIQAKKAAGYYSEESSPGSRELEKTKGRDFENQ